MAEPVIQESEEMKEGEPIPEGQDQSGEMMKMVKSIGSGLTMISQVIATMPDADPADIQEAEEITSRFQGLMDKLMQGASEGESQPQPKAKSKQIPMQSVQGKPVSPAGM